MSAIISDCGAYRYALWRDLPVQGTLNDGSSASTWFTFEETCLVVMLNPSTADAVEDDPTIRRCKGFARDLGCGRLAVANLYALRSTDPGALAEVDDPVGPENDAWIERLANEASVSIAAWGSNMAVRREPERAREVLFMLDHNTLLLCLGTTHDGHPRHPLYVPGKYQPPYYEATTYLETYGAPVT